MPQVTCTKTPTGICHGRTGVKVLFYLNKVFITSCMRATDDMYISKIINIHLFTATSKGDYGTTLNAEL